MGRALDIVIGAQNNLAPGLNAANTSISSFMARLRGMGGNAGGTSGDGGILSSLFGAGDGSGAAVKAIKVAAAVEGIRLAFDGVHVAAAAFRGDLDTIHEKLKAIPILGSVYQSAGGAMGYIADNISGVDGFFRRFLEGANAIQPKIAKITGEAWSVEGQKKWFDEFISNSRKAGEAAQKLLDDLQFEKRIAGLPKADQDTELENRRYLAERQKIDALEAAGADPRYVARLVGESRQKNDRLLLDIANKATTDARDKRLRGITDELEANFDLRRISRLSASRILGDREQPLDIRRTSTVAGISIDNRFRGMAAQERAANSIGDSVKEIKTSAKQLADTSKTIEGILRDTMKALGI